MPGRDRVRGPAALVLALLAFAVVVIQLWHGAIVLALSPRHGVDEGDLAGVALLAIAAWVFALSSWSGPARHAIRRSPGLGATTALGSLGVVLLVTGGLDALGLVPAPPSAYDAIIPGAFVLTLLWSVVATAVGPPPFARTIRGGVLVPAAVLIGGFLVDTALVPSGTILGPTLLAGYFSICARTPVARATALLFAVVFAALDVAALADIAGIDGRMAWRGGGVARSAALGSLLVAMAATEMWTVARETGSRAVPGQSAN